MPKLDAATLAQLEAELGAAERAYREKLQQLVDFAKGLLAAKPPDKGTKSSD